MDRAAANLPARDMDDTARFYEALGFTIKLKKESWMILNRGLDPARVLSATGSQSTRELFFVLLAGR